MFLNYQLDKIYELFPSQEDDIYRCKECFIRECFVECCCIADDVDIDLCLYCKTEGKQMCEYCWENDPHEKIIIRDLLIEIYKLYGLKKLQGIVDIIDPAQKVTNLYDKILIKVLDNPNCVKELIGAGANPDMNFGIISGNSNYTLLGWCLSLSNNFLQSAEILMNASKNGQIFINRDCYGRTIFGSLVNKMLRDTWSYRNVHKNLLMLVISHGAQPQFESLNQMGISGIRYEGRVHKQSRINWLIKLGVRYDLNRCTNSTSCLQTECRCNDKLLRDTRLGKYLLTKENMSLN